ncbi:MAG: alpha/beta hydrolase [Phycisphaerae bacterium]|nr:alpha/beta hydrolase [Saprospiraceae bacterium]
MTIKILLHGALGSAAQLEALQAQMPESQSAFALNFPGHGGAPANEPFSMRLFADSVLKFLDEKKAAQADIFGYSMGGYVALWLAWKHPERVRSVTTYGTKLDWTPEVAAGMSRMFDPEKIEAKAPQLADSLAKTHGAEHWKPLCHSTARFLHDLGNGLGLPPEAFVEIQCPVTIGWGDLDNVVTEAESRQVAEAIPQGRFEILPGGKHLIDQVDPAQLVRFALQNV